MVSTSHPGGKLKSIGGRIKRELLSDPQPSIGKSTLLIGFSFGLIWLFLVYFQPGYPWLNGKFLAGAVCFGFWGVADIMPRHWRGLAAILRATVLIFALGFGAWIIIDLIATF